MSLRAQEGSVAIVTGGTSGLGKAIALRLAAEGWRVVIAGRDQGRGQAAAAEIGAGAHYVRADATDRGDLERLTQSARSLGPLRGVVASAGTGLKAPLIETGEADFERILRTNLLAPLWLMQAARADLARAGGAAVLVSSDAATVGEAGIGAYSVSKAALNMAGKMLALDLAPQGIRVNIVCPGDIVPGMREMLRPGEGARPPDDYRMWPVPPLGRWGEARDVGAVAAFLLSEDAAFMTGSVVLVDGGSRAGYR